MSHIKLPEKEGLLGFMCWRVTENTRELVHDRYMRRAWIDGRKEYVLPPDCAGLLYLNEDGTIRLEQPGS